MNSYLQNIINKYSELKQFLQELNIEDFKKFSRQELMEFEKERNKYSSFRYLYKEIDDIIKQKKLEKFPELLGVHHYPEIKEIDFISEEDKIKLDNYLVGFRRSEYIYKNSSGWYNLFKKYSDEISDKIFNFLYKKGVFERSYKLYFCCDYKLLDQENIKQYLRLFELRNKSICNELSVEEDEEYDELDSKWFIYCSNCDEETEITEEMINDTINNADCYVYRLAKDRDFTYDNK